MTNNSLTPYLLIISFGSGTLGFAISIIETWFLYRFIKNNQNNDFIPKVDSDFDQTQKNRIIREFRKKIMGNINLTDCKLHKFRKILVLFKWLTTLLLTMFIITFIGAYLSSR